jgi:hypothetical protein
MPGNLPRSDNRGKVPNPTEAILADEGVIDKRLPPLTYEGCFIEEERGAT